MQLVEGFEGRERIDVESEQGIAHLSQQRVIELEERHLIPLAVGADAVHSGFARGVRAFCAPNGCSFSLKVAEHNFGALSHISIANSSAPVEVPDFTRGAWNKLKGYHQYMKGE